MSLESVTATFPMTGYLLPQSGSAPRRSSFMDGRERALAFFWEAPGTNRVLLIRTQAPYITRMIQHRFGTRVDGIFGEATRAAIEAAGRQEGHFTSADPSPIPAVGPLLGYALSRAVFNGGRVSFPAQMEYPDTNRPHLARSPTGREYSYISGLDVATGRDVPISPGTVPAIAREPLPPSAPPVAPSITNSATVPESTNALRNPDGTPVQGQVLPPPSPTGPIAPVAPGAPVTDPPGHHLESRGFEPGFGYLPMPQGGSCPKHYIDESGRCKVDETAGVYRDPLTGHMVFPAGLNAGVFVDLTDPKTYANAFPWLKK